MQVELKHLNSPSLGWVITTCSSENIVPPPTSMSEVAVRPPPPPPPEGLSAWLGASPPPVVELVPLPALHPAVQRQTRVFLFDEPTTGLHFEDIRKLLLVLGRLVDQGNTVLVIEHNLDVIKTADWIVDMGPEGGSRGGLVVAEGTPESVAADPTSFTGHFLKPLLEGREATQPKKQPRKRAARKTA